MCYLDPVNQTETLIDVRPLAPRERHPLIFGTWGKLGDGDAILLVNDHDPLPLFYQFACEHTGTFRWEYVEQGPDTWRVRVSKGNHPDPGYAPPRKMACACGSGDPSVPAVVDTRPVFDRGETPCALIEDAAAATAPGGSFVLLVPFEPMPLYPKLAKDGFSHKAERQPDGSWRVEFRKSA